MISAIAKWRARPLSREGTLILAEFATINSKMEILMATVADVQAALAANETEARSLDRMAGVIIWQSAAPESVERRTG
jgi:hypothetical protein